MNAVKNCLVVLAAAVALASCSADPNSSSAGNAVLTVSPGSVAIRANTTAEVFASAKDPLGGAVGGHYTINNPTPSVFTAIIDTSYTPVTSGTRPTTRTRIVVTAVASSGDGSFTITGTGGTVTVPVRIGPDSLTGDIAVSKTALATIDTFTATLPAGVRFTAAASVNIYHQASSADSALFSPVIVGISTDSFTATVAVGPNSGGHVRFDGIANVSTPTITYAARGATLMSSATLDTAGTDSTTTGFVNVRLSSTQPVVNDTIHANIGDTITATAPAGWVFSPLVAVNPSIAADTLLDTVFTHVHFYKGPSVNDANDGVAAPQFVSLSADSTTIKFLAAPDAKGQARFTNMRLRSNPTQYRYNGVRSLTILAVPHLPFAPTFARANTNYNTTVTVTMPAGVKLKPTTAITVSGLMKPIILTRSADSNSATLLLPPGMSGAKVTFGHLYAPAAPYFDLTLNTDNTVTTLALTDMGGDDPAGSVPVINLPALGNYGWWDVGTFEVEDLSSDAGGPGINSQVYKLILGVPATIISTVSYSFGKDIDVMMLASDTTTNTTTYGGFSGATATNPAIQNSGPLVAGAYMLDLIDWGPGFPPPNNISVGATISIALKVQ